MSRPARQTAWQLEKRQKGWRVVPAVSPYECINAVRTHSHIAAACAFEEQPTCTELFKCRHACDLIAWAVKGFLAVMYSPQIPLQPGATYVVYPKDQRT